MARRDPSSEKENMVPRVHRSEMASSGLSSVRTRGLAASEHRSHAVLKESSLQNQVSLTCFALEYAPSMKTIFILKCVFFFKKRK